MTAVGFLRSLWEKPIWDCVCPYLDPIVTHSIMEWNVSGKYGLHGELFFFLIQEPAIASNSEKFSPFINPGIRTHLFLR